MQACSSTTEAAQRIFGTSSSSDDSTPRSASYSTSLSLYCNIITKLPSVVPCLNRNQEGTHRCGLPKVNNGGKASSRNSLRHRCEASSMQVHNRGHFLFPSMFLSLTGSGRSLRGSHPYVQDIRNWAEYLVQMHPTAGCGFQAYLSIRFPLKY